ncbi:hypothetical protein FisN_9Hh174 [Fistulifera solaris]|uniref:Dienelactone hydrolase domain-containing protein n=1 Tax=Fistulifera solaris TaxID=1519565 RepID=A0A1Z5JAR3_FISSO|nr:hypothetical protein FisN_9Hh174 [Fistulifera solaris]|eukprot:GAX11084.1 hypothetical protein FisN_9Hh174 [Fistulifera solaris]
MHWLLICCCLGSIGTTVSFVFSASPTTILQPRISMTTTEDDFVPLNPESLSATSCLIEQTLCQPSSERPQLAKDFHYASAVLDAWREEELNSEIAWCTEYNSVTYHDSDGTPLYGHWVRKQGSHEKDDTFGILLFHTGAGPHDIFLLWKAASLVMALDCQVLIADILSDESGWAWDLDRSRYETVRQQVLEGEGTVRPLLQKRIRAAVSVLKSQVDENRLSALGWCLGGHSILELARMNLPEIRAMVTFHGVFDGIEAPTVAVSSVGAEILICNGVEDPFVSSQTLENALATFQQYGHRLSLLQLKGAKHGFTNPAQDSNENPAFAFHAESAHKSWHQATALLKRRCSTLP